LCGFCGPTRPNRAPIDRSPGRSSTVSGNSRAHLTLADLCNEPDRDHLARPDRGPAPTTAARGADPAGVTLDAVLPGWQEAGALQRSGATVRSGCRACAWTPARPVSTSSPAASSNSTTRAGTVTTMRNPQPPRPYERDRFGVDVWTYLDLLQKHQVRTPFERPHQRPHDVHTMCPPTPTSTPDADPPCGRAPKRIAAGQGRGSG